MMMMVIPTKYIFPLIIHPYMSNKDNGNINNDIRPPFSYSLYKPFFSSSPSSSPIPLFNHQRFLLLKFFYHFAHTWTCVLVVVKVVEALLLPLVLNATACLPAEAFLYIFGRPCRSLNLSTTCHDYHIRSDFIPPPPAASPSFH
jgi:hypothetical protein